MLRSDSDSPHPEVTRQKHHRPEQASSRVLAARPQAGPHFDLKECWDVRAMRHHISLM